VDVRTCKMRMLMWMLKTLVDRLGLGPRLVVVYDQEYVSVPVFKFSL